MTKLKLLAKARQACPQWIRRLTSLGNLSVGLTTFCIAIALIELGLDHELNNQRQAQRERLSAQVNDLANIFDQELIASLYLTNSLHAYIQAKAGALVEADLAPWLTNLQERAAHIRNIGLAPGNRITFIYPLKGNEAALGLYYPDNAQQWPMVEKTIKSRKPLLAGPLQLAQGGLGLIYREPVFLQDGSYWGLISTVINADSLFGVITAKAQHLKIKLAITDNQTKKVIWGSSERLKVTHTIALQIPRKDWSITGYSAPESLSNTLKGVRIAGWITAFWVTFLLLNIHVNRREKQQTLAALAASQKRFSDAFNMSPQSLALFDDKGNWLHVNTSFTEMFGWSEEQLPELKAHSLFAADQHNHLQNTMENLRQNYSPYTANSTQFEARLCNDMGHLLIGIVSLGITEKQKENTQWVMQIIDISHRVISERRLQEEATYNQAILNNILDGIVVFDSTGKIKSLNPAAAKMFQYRGSHLLDTSLSPLFTPEAATEIHNSIATDKQHLNISSSIFTKTITGLKKNGETFPIEMDITRLERHHEHVFVGVLRDISERVRLDQLKSEFVSIVSHELRTPLTAIIGALRLLDSGQISALDNNTSKIIRIASQNGDKLAQLINDLLDMDKLIAGKMQLNNEPLNLYVEINAALEANQNIAQQHKIRFTLEAKTTYAQVLADKMRLQQVLTNLLSNAIKFSPREGEIIIRLTTQDTAARIEIIDQGEGIAPESQYKLFQKFSQIDSSSTRQKGGTGLGLAICKALMEQMQGEIGVESRLGQGSCFYLIFTQYSLDE